MVASQVYWSNESVLKFAGHEDPIVAIEEKARSVVLEAFDKGWSGPPFDPIKLADLLKIEVRPRADIADARTVAVGKHRAVIEFNPTRPRGRVRFSLAHEIAHTFFDDFDAAVRYRSHESPGNDDWQLELLCNIAAAELIMPVGSFPELAMEDLSIERLLEIRNSYDVSMEAVLIRAAKLATSPVAAFCASVHQGRQGRSWYVLDYLIRSPSWNIGMKAGLRLPTGTVVAECSGVGFTSKGVERWVKNGPKLSVQSVGLPPYPGSQLPRVAGILKYPDRRSANIAEINYRYGNALSPTGTGPKILAHVVNDQTANWGGRGFANAVGKKWPDVQQDFRDWVSTHRHSFKLGNVHSIKITAELTVIHMIAQRGYGPSEKPRIRYSALEQCLSKVEKFVHESNSAVHMPRIGTGYAGGSWPIIEELLLRHLVRQNINVYVYDLPPSRNQRPKDMFLDGLVS